MEKTEIKRFEAGKNYETPSICDSECIYKIKVHRRTDKSVWITGGSLGRKERRAISIYDGEETIYPFGKYSMCAIIRASDKKEIKKTIRENKKCYSAKIDMPNDLKQGLQNFVQMIINEIEDSNHREALLKAVDLINDLRSGVYDSACTKTVEDSSLIFQLKKERDQALSDAKDRYNKGFIAGSKQKQNELKEILGLNNK